MQGEQVDDFQTTILGYVSALDMRFFDDDAPLVGEPEQISWNAMPSDGLAGEVRCKIWNDAAKVILGVTPAKLRELYGGLEDEDKKQGILKTLNASVRAIPSQWQQLKTYAAWHWKSRQFVPHKA